MSPAAPHGNDSWLGRVLGGRYRILRTLGEGGMGAVYVAEHLSLGRNVAVKVLHDRFAETESLRERFAREARALSRLSHPNIVTVIDFGSEADSLYLVMELVDGETLAQRLRAERPPVRVALEIVRQILRALAFAHSQGIVHRDLKPGNVLVRQLPDGTPHVTVLDFGLAKFLDDETSTALTRHGAMLGTPAYMAPEQAMGDTAEAPADVYACTLILFELLTGKRPYHGRAGGELVKAQLVEPVPAIAQIAPDVRVSAELEALVRRGLERKAKDRFPDAGAMLASFDGLPESGAQGQPMRASAAHDAARGPAGAPRPSAPDPGSFVLGSPVEPPSFVLGSPVEPPSFVLGTPVEPATYAPTYAPTAAAAHASTADVVSATQARLAGLSPRARIGLAAVAGVVLVAAVAIVWLMRGGDGGTEPAPVATTQAPAPGVPSTGGAPTAYVAPPNPWDDSVPADLKPLYQVIERGANPSRAALQSLYRYGALHRDDPRAHLLLGHTYTNRGWEGDALDAYRDAYARTQAATGDPRMLDDLLHAASLERYQRRASEYVRQWYGRAALPRLAELAGSEHDPQKAARLEQLRRELEQLP